MTDSDIYLKKRDFFSGLLTIYGRKPVMDALQNSQIEPYRLHLAESNRASSALKEMADKAHQRGAEVLYHQRDALSRISKNRKQDQGVVLDVQAPNYQNCQVLAPDTHPRLIALENVTNPQNIGMTIRSVGASPCSGIILPRKGSAPLDALVIKASAGALFKTPIFHCDRLDQQISDFSDRGYRVFGLSGQAEQKLQSVDVNTPAIFILGNETHGLTPETMSACHQLLKIPMANNIESLNVSVTAALVAYQGLL